MILTHYYIPFNKNQKCSTTSITENNIEEQQNIAKILASYSGRALRRFDNYHDYLYKRKQTELLMYKMFINNGGIPTINTPFYFVVGECEQLKLDFGSAVKTMQIDTGSISECHISFTLGDSMGIVLSGVPLKLYSLQEVEHMVNNSFDFESSMAYLKPHHRYVEAQLWDKQYLYSQT